MLMMIVLVIRLLLLAYIIYMRVNEDILYCLTLLIEYEYVISINKCKYIYICCMCVLGCAFKLREMLCIKGCCVFKLNSFG